MTKLQPAVAVPRRALAAFAAIMLFSATHAAAETYAFDKDHTEVRFSWNHLGLSRQSGRFRDVSGTLAFDPAEPEATYADVAIALRSLSTGVAALDDALVKTADFLNVAQFPVATFKSTDVRRTGGKTALMTGDLSINGVSRSVTLDVTWNFTGEHPMAKINPVFAGVRVSGFSATTQLLRSDWGIVRTIPYVSDEIQISIEAELRAESGGAPEIESGAAPPPPSLFETP